MALQSSRKQRKRRRRGKEEKRGQVPGGRGRGGGVGLGVGKKAEKLPDIQIVHLLLSKKKVQPPLGGDERWN